MKKHKKLRSKFSTDIAWTIICGHKWNRAKSNKSIKQLWQESQVGTYGVKNLVIDVGWRNSVGFRL
jgi:hypothetical protein